MALLSLSPTTLSFAFLALVALLIKFFNRTDMPKIKGIPEIPGVPIFGNLLQLGSDHARVAGEWAKKKDWPVFQVRLGNKYVWNSLHSFGSSPTASCVMKMQCD